MGAFVTFIKPKTQSTFLGSALSPPPTNQFPRSSGVLCPLSYPTFAQARQTGLYGGCHRGSITHILLIEAPPPVPSRLLLGIHSAQEFPVYFSIIPPRSLLGGTDGWFPREYVKLELPSEAGLIFDLASRFIRLLISDSLCSFPLLISRYLR